MRFKFPKGNPYIIKKGQHLSPQTEFKKGQPSRNKGKHFTEEHRNKISDSKKGHIPWNKGEKCPQLGGKSHWLWKGGITPIQNKIRGSAEYRLWIKSNFERDNFTCQKYGISGGNLEVHHINNFAEFPELRFAIDNGITLSKIAHDLFHKIYGKVNNTKKQLEEFLNNV